MLRTWFAFNRALGWCPNKLIRYVLQRLNPNRVD